MTTYTFNPSAAITPLANGDALIPFPWRQDPSATDAASVVADASIQVDGSNVTHTIKDGWRWIQLGNTGVTYNYCRSEIGLRQTVAPTPFIPGKLIKVHWEGYYNQSLPTNAPLPINSRIFISPGQLPNRSGTGSPHYAYTVDCQTGIIYVDIHSVENVFIKRVPIHDYNEMINNSNEMIAYFKPNTTGNSNGSVTFQVNGKYVYSEAGVENSEDPGQDYSKFGIYDFRRILVDPNQPEREREFTMTTELYQVTQY